MREKLSCGMEVSYDPLSRELRMNEGTYVLLSGASVAGPKVRVDLDSDDSPNLRILMWYRGVEGACVGIATGKAEASLLCRDFGRWLLRHHTEGTFDC